MNVDLLSSLPRAECADRLRQHVSSQWSLVTDSGVVGVVEGDSFTILKRIYYRNSFQRRLYGRLSDAPGGGTRIHGETRERDLTWVFILAGVVAGAGFLSTLIALYANRAQLHDFPMVALVAIVLIVPLLIAILAGAIALGRHIARGEEGFLVDWVKRTLDAR